MKHIQQKINPRIRGFTLVEIVIVLSILGIIVAMSTIALRDMYRNSALKTSTHAVYRAFTDARNNTLASVKDTVYGVMVGTSSVTRFKGPTFVVGSSTNQVTFFDAGVTATGSIVTNGTPVVFTRLTGEPSIIGAILIRDNTGTATNTLNIYASGLVEY